jgi:SpoVK/Ycf46/Vps4 family AAA+-type ATPase
VCREAAMIPVRRLMQKLDNLPKTVSLDAKHKLNRKTNILNQNANDVVSLLDGDKVNQTDLLTALSTTRPSSDGKSKRYVIIAK